MMRGHPYAMNELDISTYKFGVNKGHKGTNELPPATTSSLIQDKKIGELVGSWKWAPEDKKRDATSDLAVSPSAECKVYLAKQLER